jgi:hypothetical protein
VTVRLIEARCHEIRSEPIRWHPDRRVARLSSARIAPFRA